MAIYQRGKSYYYDFVYKGQRYTGCIGPVSRTVAKEEEGRIKTKVIEGVLNPAKARRSPRVEAFVTEYLAWARMHFKPGTCSRLATVLEHFTSLYGTKRLSELTS